MRIQVQGDRVVLSGQAVTVLRGELIVGGAVLPAPCTLSRHPQRKR